MVEVVRVSDGTVVSATTASAASEDRMEIYGWSHEVVCPRDAASSAHVLRLTALTGGVVAAVSVASGEETAYLTVIAK